MGQICCSAFPDVDIFNSCGLFSSNKTEGGKEKKLTNKAGGKLALTYTGNMRYLPRKHRQEIIVDGGLIAKIDYRSGNLDLSKNNK